MLPPLLEAGHQMSEFIGVFAPGYSGTSSAGVPGMARDHRKLKAFHLADGLALAVYQVSKNLPAAERFGLQSQLRRAALSIPTNIVEGCARGSEADYMRFVDIAVASTREVLYLIDIGQRLSLVEVNDARRVSALGNEVAGTLVNLRKSYGR